jgi:hypothetical protein
MTDTSPPKIPVWVIAIQVMLECEEEFISRSHFGALDTIGLRATHTKLPRLHPLDRHVAVLNAVERSGRFNKSYIRLDRRSRAFTPTPEALREAATYPLAQEKPTR